MGKFGRRWHLASEHSRSPNETRLRLIVELDAGITALHVNCPVHDRDGRLLGIADLLDELRAWSSSTTGQTTEARGAITRMSKRSIGSGGLDSRWHG